MSNNEEVTYSTHCMSCENGNEYSNEDTVPESYPICGEHKNYTILIN